MQSRVIDEVATLLTTTASPLGFHIAREGPTEVAVQSADARVLVEFDAAAREYRVHDEATVVDVDLGRGDEFAGTYEPHTGTRSHLIAGAGKERRWSRVFHPDTRQFDADPSGRIDAFLRDALTPAGWTRRWTATDQKWFALMVGIFVVVFGLFIGVAAYIWSSVSPWAGGGFLALVLWRGIGWLPGLLGLRRSAKD